MVPPCVSKDFSQQTYSIKCQKITSLLRVFRCAFHKNALFSPSNRGSKMTGTEASFTINRGSVCIRRSLCFTIFLQRIPHKKTTCAKSSYLRHHEEYYIPTRPSTYIRLGFEQQSTYFWTKFKKQNIICKK